MYRSTSFFLLTLTVFTSCQNDLISEDGTETINDNIPYVLTPYFQAFKEKALEYNIEVDYDATNVTAEIKIIDEGSVAGSCTTNGHDLTHITIDQNFWNQASHLLREMVIFHELGHCILGRGHREDSFSNGVCRSIMRSGLGTCMDAYIPENRDYFIQELFVIQN